MLLHDYIFCYHTALLSIGVRQALEVEIFLAVCSFLPCGTIHGLPVHGQKNTTVA